MKKIIIKEIFLIVTAIMLVQCSVEQKKEIPIIKANSTMVDIKEDDVLMKNLWTIVPEEELDVYETSAKKVTFYTDIDSISFKIVPGKTYDFIILLNGKDSARTQIKHGKSKLEILKSAEKYNYSDKRFIPEFTYQSADNPNLKKVREELKLDSIAGKGDELSQIFNLLYWLHNLVNHENQYTKTDRNAIDIIEFCKKENCGVNCRMLAITLNECYLAMGIKSRYITCLPKDSTDSDCHVINMVYSKDLKKWIWIDPSFAAYVMDEKGNLLGIQEVRERLIKGKPLILNADANYRREIIQNKEWYLEHYMAKNLYKFSSPLYSEYNLETWQEGKETIYVELLPLDEIKQTPQKIEESYGSAKIIRYKTNNPDLFWVEPK